MEYWRARLCGHYMILSGKWAISRSKFTWSCEIKSTQKQALRLGLLAGQALERSDNPAIVRRKRQPLRVGLSKYPHIAV